MPPEEQNKKDEHYNSVSHTVAAAIVAAIVAVAVWLIVVNIGLLNAGAATGVSMLLWVILTSGLIAQKSKKESRVRNGEHSQE